MNPLSSDRPLQFFFQNLAPEEVWYIILRQITPENRLRGLQSFASTSREAYDIVASYVNPLLERRRASIEELTSSGGEYKVLSDNFINHGPENRFENMRFAAKGEDGTIYFRGDAGRFYNMCLPRKDSKPIKVYPNYMRFILPLESGVCVVSDRSISFKRSYQENFQIVAYDAKDFFPDGPWKFFSYAFFGSKLFFVHASEWDGYTYDFKGYRNRFFEIDFLSDYPKVVRSEALNELFNKFYDRGCFRIDSCKNSLYIISATKIIEAVWENETFTLLRHYMIPDTLSGIHRANRKWLAFLKGNELIVINKKTGSQLKWDFPCASSFHLQGDFAIVYDAHKLYLINLESRAKYDHSFTPGFFIKFAELQLDEECKKCTLQVHFTRRQPPHSKSWDYQRIELESLDWKETGGEDKVEHKIEFIDQSSALKSKIGSTLTIAGIFLALITTVAVTILLYTQPGLAIIEGAKVSLTAPTLGVLVAGGSLALLILTVGLIVAHSKRGCCSRILN